MNKDYVELPIGKIIIVRDKKQNKYYKEINNELVNQNFQLRNYNSNQSILGNIQSTLINYFLQKISKDKENNKLSQNAYNEVIKTYKSMLVTPEALTLMKRDPNNYTNIIESINRI